MPHTPIILLNPSAFCFKMQRENETGAGGWGLGAGGWVCHHLAGVGAGGFNRIAQDLPPGVQTGL